MSTYDVDCRNLHLQENWMSWLALNHFLPSYVLRELVLVILECATGGRLKIDSIFDEVQSHNELWSERWMLQPIEQDDSYARYFQGLIRALVWQGDNVQLMNPDIKHDRDQISPSLIDDIYSFGMRDLSVPFNVAEFIASHGKSELQPSILAFMAEFDVARKVQRADEQKDMWGSVLGRISHVEMPLSAIILKHFADLFADVDQWKTAQQGYEKVQSMLVDWSGTGWEDIKTAWISSTVQSRAAAARVLDGPDAAAEILAEFLKEKNLRNDTLAVANMSFDAFVASVEKDTGFWSAKDSRVAVVGSRLLQRSHDISDAIQNWVNHDYKDSHRYFWAHLRRKIALGASAEAKITKILYARSLLDQLSVTTPAQSDPRAFEMAIRLLIEGGSHKSVELVLWNEHLANAYVNDDMVSLVIRHSAAHLGTQIERQLVCVELFKEWTALLAPNSDGVALRMWDSISHAALEFEVSLNSSRDVGRRALEALNYLARKRPELSRKASPRVTSAIVAKLNLGGPLAMSAAFETALHYVDAFSESDLDSVLLATLRILGHTEPTANAWPVVRPAMDLLVSKPIKRYVANRADHGKPVLDAILRFGTEQETERKRLLFYLHDYDKQLLGDPLIRTYLEGTLTELRQCAKAINSSAVTECISALLIAPAIAGGDGLSDALDSLVDILESALTSRPSIAFAQAYSPIIILADALDEIRNQLPEHVRMIDAALERILSLLCDIWNASAKNVLLFAPFSLPPPTKPNPIVVHNWAFASMRFAESLNQLGRINRALSAASGEPLLADPISSARATRSAVNPASEIDLEQVRIESRDGFYAGLGRRLAQLQHSAGDNARNLAKVLAAQCIRLGPRALDVAVFLEVLRLGLQDEVRAHGLADYITRLENDRELRLTLIPIVELLKER